MKPKTKWRFAIGTTSRVPRSGGSLHYLIADFDAPSVPEISNLDPANHIILQKTKHGWHLYTDIELPFKTLVDYLEVIGADQSWIDIGKERGYFFLADKDEIDFPYPVEHMAIHYSKKSKEEK